MSDSDTLSALAQEFTALFPAIFASRYSALSSAVLLLYDYFLTFPLELRHIWHGKMNIMKILFIFNRYFSIISIYTEILLLFINLETTAECRVFYYTDEVTDILAAIAVLSIFTLRSFAIYGRSKIVFLLLAAPALVDVSSGIWLTVTQTAAAFPPQQQIGPLNCGFNQSASNFTALLVNITSSAIFDVLVVIFTVYRTGRLALQSRQANINGSLSFILLRDGMVYYSAIFIPQLVLVALNAVTLKTNSENLSNASNSLSYVNSSVQTVIVNRLVLNLCQAANTHEDSEFRTKTGLEPPVFATGPILGNIGGPVLTPFVDPDNEVFEGEGRVCYDEVEVTSRQPSSTNTKEAENFSLNGVIEFRSSSDAGADSV